jgi:hypothetical protein
MSTVLAALLFAAAAPPGITSAYTRLDLDRCRRIDRSEEMQSARWRCTGHGGVPLFVQNGDERFDVDAGREDANEFWSAGFDYPGSTVEWRLLRGKPFAVIYRLNSSGDEQPKWSRLIVETVGRDVSGCRIASIDARRPDANAEARVAADRAARGAAPCMKAGH